MKPELKYLFSIDLEDRQLPENPDDCTVFIEANIGLKGEEGSDIFSFEVVTPKSLQRINTPRWGRGLLIVESFSWEIIEVFVKKLLHHCEGKNWNEISHKINKELHWEFDNYQDYEG